MTMCGRRWSDNAAFWRRQPSSGYREEGGVIVLSDSDEETIVPTPSVRSGDPWQGCSNDVGDPPSGDDGEYTTFYKLLGMN
ncbi:hypothetical protein D1007_11854 [Hordeum vulgare]|nr:hypothetical protein D1007_11854 [Hordeum vulgare]